MIEVAVFCRNEAPRIERCLGSLREQAETIAAEHLPLRGVVLENGSTDGTAAAAGEAGRRLCAEGRFELDVRDGLPPGKARAWNTFLSLAQSPLVGFMDADVTLAPDTLARLLERLAGDGSLDLVAARPTVSPGFRPASFWQAVFTVPYAALRPAPSLCANAYVARRARLRPLDPDTVNEDLVLSLRHGAAASVHEGAPVYVVPPARLREFVRQRARIRRSDAVEAARFGTAVGRYRRRAWQDVVAFHRAAGPVRLGAFLFAGALGAALARLPAGRGEGWVPVAGRGA